MNVVKLLAASESFDPDVKVGLPVSARNFFFLSKVGALINSFKSKSLLQASLNQRLTSI